MHAFDLAAILLTVAAICGYLNHRLLRLPATTGTLAVALFSSLLVIAANAIFPQLAIQYTLATFVRHIDFNQILMHGMLSFLLFAGALHLDLEGLLDNKRTIALLSTVGVGLSTVIVGGLMWGYFVMIGAAVPALVCFVFGALISPTDPIAVMGLLKDLRAPKSLEAQIAGESLFNDGIGVVLFVALASVADLSGDGHALAPHAGAVATFFLREVGGGALLGLSLGYLAYITLKSIDDRPLELLITVALVMFTYALSFAVHASGPIAVVVAGVLIGNPGRRLAMSERTREHVDAFWSMIDEILNTVLFLLLGVEVLAVRAGWAAAAAGLVSIVVVLVARFTSVGIPISAINFGRNIPGIVPMLTWTGLRGGLSIAMALSLPQFPARELLLTCTYSVVVFSILVQGLTVRRVLLHYGLGEVR